MNPRDAFLQTVYAAPGGPEALAPRMGMAVGILRNKANPQHSYNKPTLDEVDRIMGLTGDLQILHALAANHGCVVVEVGEDATPSDMAILEMVTQVWKTNGEVGAEINSALADGRITAAELARVKDAVKRAERALEGVSARLAGMSEPDRAGGAL